MDVRASIPAPVKLQPMERVVISTGLFIELPNGYEAQIRPRSGLAVKHGITCLNTPEQVIHPGDRIAQMVIQRVEKAELEEVEILNETIRAGGGFGHTGKQ